MCIFDTYLRAVLQNKGKLSLTLFWKSHCISYIPACLIFDVICSVFISDNNPIRLGWNELWICGELPRTVQWSLIYSDQKDYSRLWAVSLLLKDLQGKKLWQTRGQDGSNRELCLFLTPALLMAPPLPSVHLHFLPGSSLSKRDCSQAPIAPPWNENETLAGLFTVKNLYISACLCSDHQARGHQIYSKRLRNPQTIHIHEYTFMI